MPNLNGRLRRIEAQIPPIETEEKYTIYDLAGEIITAIDAGHILDWSDKPPDKWTGMFCIDSLNNPTTADHFGAEIRSNANRLIHHGQKLVADFAKATGWRSVATEPYRSYTGYRANSAQELHDVMRAILDHGRQEDIS